MMHMAEEVVRSGMTRDDARASRRAQMDRATNSPIASKANPTRKPYIYRYSAPGNEFKLEIKFRRSTVKSSEVAEALREVIEQIKV